MNSRIKVLYAPLHDENSVVIDETIGEPISSIWLYDTNAKQRKVVFVMDKAQQIHAHLLKWADGKPEEFFSAHWTHDDALSVLALIPNVEKAFSRLKVSSASSLNDNAEIYSRYISSVAVMDQSNNLDNEVYVNIAMIDPEFLNKGEWDASYADHFNDVGKFKIMKNTDEVMSILHGRYYGG